MLHHCARSDTPRIATRLALLPTLLWAFGSPLHAHAKDLLSGTISVAGETPMEFRLSGKSRKDVVGGEINVGKRRFAITNVSRRGLIGGRGLAASDDVEGHREFVVFSSSFSEQTATGQPWLSALEYRNCDTSYNSFLALYHIRDTAVATLGPTPYSKLTDDSKNSARSVVYCFMSRKESSE